MIPLAQQVAEINRAFASMRFAGHQNSKREQAVMQTLEYLEGRNATFEMLAKDMGVTTKTIADYLKEPINKGAVVRWMDKGRVWVTLSRAEVERRKAWH